MSTKTNDLIQKICYKKTASVDMTKHGFINDNKFYAVNLMLRPLKEKLEKICGIPKQTMIVNTKKSASRKYKVSGKKLARSRVLNNKLKTKKVLTKM